MSLSLTRMRALVRKGLGGLSSTDLPDLDTDELLNLSLWELEDKYEFEAKETQWTTPLVTDQFEYGLPASPFLLDAIVSIAVINAQGERLKLDRISRMTYDEIFDDDNKDLPNKYFRENLILTIYPTPGADQNALTLSLTAKKSIASIVDGSNDATGLPRNWDELVVMGAVARGHFWNSDYDKAMDSRNFQVGIVRSTVPTQSKEEEDSRYAGLDIADRRPTDSLARQDVFNPRVAP
ncbi:MAG: hypothetical protein V3T23_03145 [Nitrososphaerales archaeon]